MSGCELPYNIVPLVNVLTMENTLHATSQEGRDGKVKYLRYFTEFFAVLYQVFYVLKEELHLCMQALCMQITMVTYKRERD